MSHDLWLVNGEAQFFSGRDMDAWHGLGKKVKGCVTAEEAMKLAGLDWTVSKKPLYANQEGDFIALPAWGIFRDTDNAYLGYAGAKYTPIQNVVAFETANSIIGYEGAYYDTAGALNEGKQIFMSIHLPTAGFEPVDGDKHLSYLLALTSHDGSENLRFKYTEVRVVCANTKSQALKGAGSEFRIRHTKSYEGRITEVVKLVQTGIDISKDMNEKYQTMCKKEVTEDTFKSIMTGMFPVNVVEPEKTSTKTLNDIQEIKEMFKNNDDNKFPEISGTAYALFNAFTRWTDHNRTAKGGGKDLIKTQIKRSESSMFGSGEIFKDKAFDLVYATLPKMKDKPKPLYFV